MTKPRYYRQVYVKTATSPDHARELLQEQADKHGANELGHVYQKASGAAVSVAELHDYEPLDGEGKSG